MKSAEAAYKAAKAKLESLQETLGVMGKEEFRIKPRAQKQKVSALKELAARRLEAQQREEERRRSGKEKKPPCTQMTRRFERGLIPLLPDYSSVQI